MKRSSEEPGENSLIQDNNEDSEEQAEECGKTQVSETKA